MEEVEQFQLPEQEPKWLTDRLGTKIKIIGHEYKPKSYDVCPDCAAYLWTFISQYLPIIRDKNSDYVVTICLDKKLKKN